MKFELVEDLEQWIVRRDGVELARYGNQLEALADVTERLQRAGEVEGSHSLAMRYRPRTASGQPFAT
jgi:hypothetical protein